MTAARLRVLRAVVAHPGARVEAIPAGITSRPLYRQLHELEATGHVYRTGSQREGYRWFATATGEARSRRDATPLVIVDILDSLRTLGEATTADLAEHTGRTRKHVHNALRRAGIVPARIERNRLAVWRTP